MDKNTIDCCANCKHCLEFPRKTGMVTSTICARLMDISYTVSTKTSQRLSILLPAAGNSNADMKGRKQYDRYQYNMQHHNRINNHSSFWPDFLHHVRRNDHCPLDSTDNHCWGYRYFISSLRRNS